MTIKMCKNIFYSLLLLIFTSGFSLANSDDNKLRMALLPIPDVLPVYVAIEQGYFKDSGIEVEALTVGSPIERDQLMQAGRVDGMINEISGAASFNRDQSRVKIVSIARSPIDNSPLFRVLAAPQSGIKNVKELAGIGIGVSRNTIIEYISTRLLTADGVAPKDVVFQSVPVLPERFQLLLSGQLKAATLPDPLASAAIKAGAVDVINDTKLSQLSASVISFSNEAVTKKGEAVNKFMQAWDKAAAELNSAPEKYKPVMLKYIKVPKIIHEDFSIPPFPRKALPSKEQWDDVMLWMVDKKLVKESLQYEESVTAEFLSK